MAKKVDIIQHEIIQKLRSVVGVTVFPTHMAHFGFPDIVVGRAGVNYLLEIKMPGQKLTKYQEEFHNNWRGKVSVVHSWEEAFRAIGIKV